MPTCRRRTGFLLLRYIDDIQRLREYGKHQRSGDSARARYPRARGDGPRRSRCVAAPHVKPRIEDLPDVAWQPRALELARKIGSWFGADRAPQGISVTHEARAQSAGRAAVVGTGRSCIGQPAWPSPSVSVEKFYNRVLRNAASPALAQEAFVIIWNCG